MDEEGEVLGANRLWKNDGGEKLAGSEWIQSVLRELRTWSNPISKDIEDGGIRHRVTLTRHNGKALVLKQPLEAAKTRRGEQLEAVGRLVGGVAHDFANLLTLISGYSDILLNRVGERDPIRPELLEIFKAATRGSRLTAQLLGFTRGQAVEPKILDLNAVILDLQRMLRPVIGEHIELRTELQPALGRIMADTGQMEQVILNLVLNARDAMPTGGLVVIQTANCQIDEATAEARGIAPGPAVMLAVTDTGRGIDPEILDRLWEPFFSTKEPGKGTGLGLNTVQTIIRNNKGNVWVTTVPGQGTTFTVCLPQVREAVEAPDTAVYRIPEVSQGETVLVVEDEDGVRNLLRQVLERRGFQVLAASSGPEALEIYRARAGEIDLVLTDMVMPRMSGRELAGRLLQIRPDARVIFMSGYTDDVLVRTGALSPGMSFLQKPLRPEILVAKVREALDSPSRPFNPQ